MAEEISVSEKILDIWTPPSNAGEPLGFISTTFTFNGSFFEEHCLSGFLKMESDPDSEGISYVIEREEKLNMLECAMILVDQRNCKAQRNLRWDLIPIRLKSGIQHAKINLLCWTDCIRITIGSANLTEDGYRTNQEIYASFDAQQNASIPLDVFEQALNFLEQLLNNGATASNDILLRGYNLIKKARKTLLKWNVTEHNEDKKGLYIYPVFTFPGSESAIEQISKYWTRHYSFLPDTIRITSPFFDENPHLKLPIHEINRSLISKNGGIYYHCQGEYLDKNKDVIQLDAPSFLSEINEKNSHFYLIENSTESENFYRPLHLKTIVLKKANWILMLSGSSNFTAAGMATGLIKNYEANIAFITSSSISPNDYNALENCHPESYFIPDEKKIKWLKVMPEDDAESTAEYSTMPEFLISAEADLIDSSVIIRFTFTKDASQIPFLIRTDEGKTIFDNTILEGASSYEYLWYDRKGTSNEVEQKLPIGFEIIWEDNTRKAWIPLNVLNYDCLPPPEQLKDLSLHILIQILTSAKSLHVLLRRYFKELNENGEDDYEGDVLIDPHKRVDTSAFLLQRTRKISFAFKGIKEKLESPSGSIDSLRWKLYGPVGVRALVNAISNDTINSKNQLPEERLFFLAELILELSSVQPERKNNFLSPKQVKDELNLFIEEVIQQIKKDKYYSTSWIKHYISKAINTSRKNGYLQ